MTDSGQALSTALDQLEAQGEAMLALLPLLGVAALLVVLAILIAFGVGRLPLPPARVVPHPFARNFIRQSIRVVIVTGGLLLALDLLGATALVGALLGTAGVAGLAVGFAFRDIIENYLAGGLLSIRHPFAPNDHVQLDGHEGRVVRLTGRDTVLMTLDGNHVRIPNAMVFKSAIVNFSRNPLRRFLFSVGVGMEEDFVQVRRLGLEALREVPGVLADPSASVRVQELGDSVAIFRFSGWVNQQEVDFGKVRSEAIRIVKESLDRNGISMPSPEYRLLFPRESTGTPIDSQGEAWLRQGAEARSSGTKGPAPGMSEPDRGATEPDVAVDRSLDAQIDEDRRLTGEEDLLSPGDVRSSRDGGER